MESFAEREIRRLDGRVKTLSDRIDMLAKRLHALESVSPPEAAPSESACAPVRRSMKTEEDRRFWAGVGEAARDAPKTGETPPTDPDLHRGPMTSGGGEDPIDRWLAGFAKRGGLMETLENAAAHVRYDDCKAEIVAVVRAAAAIVRDDEGIDAALGEHIDAVQHALDALRAKLRDAQGGG